MKKLIILIILAVVLLSGCHWFQDNRVRVNPTDRVDKESPKYRAMIQLLIHKDWKGKEYLAEIEYLKYTDSQK